MLQRFGGRPYIVGKEMPVRVFISYACVDNKPDPGATMGLGWVDLLRERLKQRLPSYAGGDGHVRIDMDNQPGRVNLHIPLDEQFRSMVKAADVFIAVGSPTYFLSKWCRGEFGTFVAKSAAEKKCLIKLQLFQNCGRLPDDWEETRVLRFFTDEGVPFTEDVGSLKESAPYQARMTELINKLGALVQELAEKSREDAEPVAQVYLAEAEDTLEVEMEQVRAGLQDQGIVAVEGDAWPEAEYEARLGEILNRPNMVYVQLLSPKPGRRLREKVRQQYAAATTVPALARMVWRDPAKVCDPSADNDHKAMWESAMRDKAIDGFIVDVVNRVRAGRSGNAPVNDVPRVFIHGHELDAPTTEKIGKDIDNTSCARVVGPPNQAGVNPLGALLQQVRPCDGLLVLDGECPPEWVRTQMMVCLKELLSREQKMPVCGLLMLPPQAKAEPAILAAARSSRKFVPINCRSGYDADKLGLFIAFLEPDAP
jgi:hypothetical protein